VLSAAELRARFERQRPLLDTLDRIRPRAHFASDLQRLFVQRSDVARRLTDARAVFERSTQTLEHYDRPLRRRRHHTAIANAKAALRTTADQIRRCEAELDCLDRSITEVTYQHELNRRDVAQLPRLNLELDRIDERLDSDRQARAGATHHQHDQFAPVLGPRPTGPTARDWHDTAGRLHQLDLAYGPTDRHDAFRRLEAHDRSATPEHSTRLVDRSPHTRTVAKDGPDLGLSLL
jgi:hypothetical protein